MSRLGQLATGVSAGATAVVAVPVGYLGVMTVLGAASSRSSRRPARPTVAARTRFVVLVPAHDEASTIETMLASLIAQDHPTDLFRVHVVADNCADDTAAVARRAGAEVHERFDPVARGKGPALNWLVGRLVEREEPFDVAVFVDADTTVSPGFLSVLDERFQRGALAVQGHYGVREAFESAPAAIRYCALACRHHLRPLGRRAVGGSCGLFGNGMAFRRDLIVARRWTDHLVEDMEFQLELLMSGVVVDYEPRAVVEAEMPHTFAASVTQHQRWERGRMQIARRYAPMLGRRVLGGPPPSRLAAADALADMCVPPLSMLAAGVVAVATSNTALALVAPTATRRRLAASGAVLLATILIHVATALRLVGAPRAAYLALLQAPRLVLFKLAVLTRRGGRDREWIRTTRNAEVDG